MGPLPPSESSHDAPATWRNLPRKDQLFVLAFCRVFDFMQVASFQTICYYQLKLFNTKLPEETISWQSGIASGSFSAAQIFTAIIWGRIADAEWGGRKRVLLIGLWGTAVGCLGLAFSRSFVAVVISRLLAGGANGTVGIIRTMISENIKERKHQSRAFLLLPASFMIASVVGPVIGSWLAEPVATFPSLFAADSWLASFPYALPALFSAASMVIIGFYVFLMIEETHGIRKAHFDLGLHCASVIRRAVKHNSHEDYSTLENDDQESEDEQIELPEVKALTMMSLSRPSAKSKPSFRSIWTYNVIATLLAQAIFDFHMGAFGNLLPLFLSSPRRSVARYLPFIFNGGFGMAPRSVGLALAILGCIGIILQFLIYPRINTRLGNVQCFRIFSTLFPVAYILAPFLAILPQDSASLKWLGITAVIGIHTTGRIFVLPATIVLLNNCAPDPSVLGMVHGVGQTTSALFRTLGPVVGGWAFGKSWEGDFIGGVWWGMAVVAVVGWAASLLLWERAAS
ncbi:related to E.coli tetracycline resistance protein TCR1 [Rhynchosporium graminicola]|uniref:Related to E.coli tetracycline resistance protein TCR1 n=1 Tax=Rhynchosporium graminicola TaxID=2792576 RepID=A0A1E1JZ00_9HELO|nr:related to E.coli tetracycline resistance protein TCR1 [Rhynchosporium commune]